MGDDTSKQQANLRKKISKHKQSKAHIHSEQIKEKCQVDIMPKQIIKLSDLTLKTTECI